MTLTKRAGHVADHVVDRGGPAMAAREILTPVNLPCGRQVPNRLVKAAMYEHMSTFLGGPPNAAHFELYSRWARGRWGMILTGNVLVASDHLVLAREIVVPERITADTIEPFRQLANAIHGEALDMSDPMRHRGDGRPLAIMQLSHTGRQSTNILGGRWPFVPPMAPSAVPVGRKSGKSSPSSLSRLLYAFAFQTPRAMSLANIDAVVDAFVKGALLAAQSDFDGIELHAAHGYLISEFISLKSNHRTDAYSARDNPLHFLHRIVSAIRAPGVLPEDFVLGIKLNAADYTEDNADTDSQEDRVLQHVKDIAGWGLVDFIEISGGDYEDPGFMKTATSPRQALFSRFSQGAMRALASQEHTSSEPIQTDTTSSTRNPAQPPAKPLILLTGGLRTLPLLASALAQKHAHLLGIGRLAVLCPELPRQLRDVLASDIPDDTFLLEPPLEPDIHGIGAPLAPAQRWTSAAAERALVALLLAAHSLVPLEFPRLIGAGAGMAWHIVMLRRVAVGAGADYTVGGLAAVLRMWLWSAPGAEGAWDSWVVMGLVGLVAGLALGHAL